MRTVKGGDLLELHGAVEMIEKAYAPSEQEGREVNQDLVADPDLQRLLPGRPPR